MKNEKFVIVALKNMYGGQTLTSTPNRFVMMVADNDVILESTPAQATLFDLPAAKELVEKLEEERYICGNGESGRPDYLILSESSANVVFYAASENNYPWDECVCDKNEGEACGECDVCCRFTIKIDRERYEEAAIHE